jgi:hypothetical protein
MVNFGWNRCGRRPEGVGVVGAENPKQASWVYDSAGYYGRRQRAKKRKDMMMMLDV